MWFLFYFESNCYFSKAVSWLECYSALQLVLRQRSQLKRPIILLRCINHMLFARPCTPRVYPTYAHLCCINTDASLSNCLQFSSMEVLLLGLHLPCIKMAHVITVALHA